MPRLTRIYTKTGDEGMTGLGGGQRVPKDSQRVETYGTVDELNSQIGVALATGLCERLTTELTPHPERAVRPRVGPGHARRRPRRVTRVPTVEARHVEKLERLIDEFNEVVGPLANFLLPGGSPGAAQLHVARTVCRRAERAGDDARPRRGDRRRPSSPTSIASRTRSSSWRATRTTNGRRRTALGAWDLMSVLSKVKGTGSSGIAARRADRTAKPHASRHERREAGRERHHKTGEPAWEAGDRGRTRDPGSTRNPDAAPEILGGR